MKSVAIVGGGITGLSAAWQLEQLTDAEIDLYEASDVLGGKLRTYRYGDFLIEGGPDCFFARRPVIRETIDELGISDQLIEPQAKEFSIFTGAKMHRVPGGLTNLRSPSADAIREATFLSEEGKTRALDPQPVEVGHDISIRAFFSARYGPEFSRLAAEPLLAGTHGGGALRLSMRALYPAYLEDGPAEETPRGPTFLSFRNGMQTLPRALAGALKRTRVHLGRPLYNLPEADRILLAIPAPEAARFVPPGAAALLKSIPHRDSRILTEGYALDSGFAPLRGTGFLVPEGEEDLVSSEYTGATYSSLKWARRAPAATFLVRLFSRVGARPDRVRVSDQSTPKPWVVGRRLFAKSRAWLNALPQYELGHLDLVWNIETAMRSVPHVFLAGTSYRGIGVPDCVRQGREVARKIADSL